MLSWGLFAGVTAGFLFERVPIFRADILAQVPLIGSYWKEKLEKAAQVD
jgi:hypothetical protein